MVEALGLSLTEFVFYVINFLILVGLLTKFLYRPFLNMLETRKQSIQDALDNAELINRRADEKMENYDRQIVKLEEQGREIIKEAKERAEKQADEIIEEAHSKANSIIVAAERQVELEKQKALEEMKQQDMEIESEFLTMAARLVHMKTISLLPKHEELEELQDELVTQLLDYQQCKRMAQIVKDRLELGTFVRAQMKLKKDLTYRGHHDTGELLTAYQTAVGKGKRFLPPPMESFSAIVATPTVSVASGMIHVLRCLWKEHEVPYTKVFEQAESKSQMVATFLAVLELVKGKRVRVEDENGSSKLVLLDGGERNWKRKHKKVQ